MTAQANIGAVASEVIASLSSHSQIPPFSSRPAGLKLAEAYQVTPLLRASFEGSGEEMTGRKIGFTNRQMWTAFGVDSPIWGYTTSHTTRDLADVHAVDLSDFSQPRIEPEIMFGLGATPAPATSDSALVDCVEWIALGYEIVQSIFPGWRFSAADTVAANGLHGALLIGRRHEIASRKAEWQRELSTFEVELHCDGELVQRGGGSLVLGSPLTALRSLVELLANDPHNPPLRASEVVSTGTLTIAMPVKAGERWTTRASGIPLEDIAIRFD
jgi:2-oxo-3-hexenedioate decarboxylase